MCVDDNLLRVQSLFQSLMPKLLLLPFLEFFELRRGTARAQGTTTKGETKKTKQRMRPKKHQHQHKVGPESTDSFLSTNLQDVEEEK